MLTLNNGTNSAGGGGGGDGWGGAGAAGANAAQGDFEGDDAATDAGGGGDEAASEIGASSDAGTAAGAGAGSSVAGTRVNPRASITKSSGFAGIGINMNTKQQQQRLLKAVAYFALPTNDQLGSLDSSFASMGLNPTCFRLDLQGRFAAVTWCERSVCVYDIYTLLMLNVLQRPQSRPQRAQIASATSTSVNVVRLSIFGAFPCRAVPQAAGGGGIEYSLGPHCFHPNMPVLLLTVLRQRSVQRVALTGASALKGVDASDGANVLRMSMPLPPLVYAISLQVHQAILSTIGCYEVGSDRNLSAYASSAAFGASLGKMSNASSSLNWRPRNVDCTPHTGMLLVNFTAASTCTTAGASRDVSNILDAALPVDDINDELGLGLPMDESYRWSKQH